LHRTVGELMQMPAREFDRWRQFYDIRPFGETAAYLRSAQTSMMLANINRDAKKHPEGYPLSDFLLFAPEPELPDADEVADKVLGLFSQLAGAS
jgi:hypothetical protein